jgi:hypothetical protein
MTMTNETEKQEDGTEQGGLIDTVVMPMTLQLTLKKKWFDLIAKGEKRFEYREYKKHWMCRLLGRSGIRNYDEIRFTNGYGKDKPFLRVEFEGAAIIEAEHCSPENGELLDPEQKYFVIGLGKVLEAGNA